MNLAVIVGAGASNDLIPPALGVSLINYEGKYTPPLTKDLFNLNRAVIDQVMVHYPLVHTSLGILKRNLEKQGLEDYMLSLRDSKEELDVELFGQIPLYLQHLFGKISETHCTDPSNYSSLVFETLKSKTERVCYITLNYDLFFEQALSKRTKIPFTDLSQYIPQGKKWALIKMHGSVNWGKKIKKVSNPGETLGALLDNISNLNPAEDIESEIVIDSTYRQRPDITKHFYPALSVPVSGDYKLNCPPEHVKKLEELLRECTHFLIIGVSGRDQDLLEKLNENVSKAQKVAIVGKEHVDEDMKRFLNGVEGFDGSVEWQIHNSGFSNFIAEDGIEKLLS